MNASGYCRTIIETEETFSSDNLRMIVLWSDNKQVPKIVYRGVSKWQNCGADGFFRKLSQIFQTFLENFPKFLNDFSKFFEKSSRLSRRIKIRKIAPPPSFQNLRSATDSVKRL